MEKVLVSIEGNYILLRNVVEIRIADGDQPHFMEVRVIGDTEFIPVGGKSTDLLQDGHLQLIDASAP